MASTLDQWKRYQLVVRCERAEMTNSFCLKLIFKQNFKQTHFCTAALNAELMFPGHVRTKVQILKVTFVDLNLFCSCKHYKPPAFSKMRKSRHQSFAKIWRRTQEQLAWANFQRLKHVFRNASNFIKKQ